jgi:hypothetical protein
VRRLGVICLQSLFLVKIAAAVAQQSVTFAVAGRVTRGPWMHP